MWDFVPRPTSFFGKKLGKKLSNATQSVAIMGFQRDLSLWWVLGQSPNVPINLTLLIRAF